MHAVKFPPQKWEYVNKNLFYCCWYCLHLVGGSSSSLSSLRRFRIMLLRNLYFSSHLPCIQCKLLGVEELLEIYMRQSNISNFPPLTHNLCKDHQYFFISKAVYFSKSGHKYLISKAHRVRCHLWKLTKAIITSRTFSFCLTMWSKSQIALITFFF